jgi:protein O-mannosyl-transferase
MASAAISPGAVHSEHRTGPTDGVLRRPALLSLLLLAGVVLLYYPVHHHPFINYDDNDYVYGNHHVQGGITPGTIRWSFTTVAAANWHPITWLSHAADCQLFGLDPAGHHDMNVLFHAVNVLLLFWVLYRATGYAGRSFMVAALFALHPVNVESVAWVAERKTLLSAMFFLLALGVYRWYAQNLRGARFAVLTALFAAGLMAKAQIITLPFVLLLWDLWPLRRWEPPSAGARDQSHESQVWPFSFQALVREKIPLFLITGAGAIVTMYAQRGVRSGEPLPFRLGNAALAYALYLRNAFWPANLALLYPHPGRSLSRVAVAFALLLLLGITALVLRWQRHRYLPVGWFWFLGTLVPMLGIVQVGLQAMADRYAYLSFVGLFLMVCWGTAELCEEKRMPTRYTAAASLVVLIALGVTARRQIDYWRAEDRLWEHTLQVTTRNWVAEGELASYLAMNGRVPEALPHFRAAIAIYPDDVTGHLGLAMSASQRGLFREAVAHYEVVVKHPATRPENLEMAYLGLARAYRALGERAKSQYYFQALRDLQAH